MSRTQNKKKLIVVNDNLNVGGIQKALVNFLNAQHECYDITLLLVNKNGGYLSSIPEDVKVLGASALCSVFGASKNELKGRPLLFLLKGLYKLLLRVFDKRTVLSLAFIFQKSYTGYDAAISFTHPCKKKDMRSCSAELVLKKTQAEQKICLVHCDYGDSSLHDEYTDSLFMSFDKIACCSDSVKSRLVSVLAQAEGRTYTLRNFYDLFVNAQNYPAKNNFDNSYINMLSVARLSSEKGIERAIDALFKSGREDIRYYIIGNGPLKARIEEQIKANNMQDRVFLLGEIQAPYSYLCEADYLLVPSFHEAAPIVFDEAKALGTQVLTTQTLSAKEIIKDGLGAVCQNSSEGILKLIKGLQKPQNKESVQMNNDMQTEQLRALLQQ